MARKYRKRVDSQTKIEALRRHLMEKVPVSDVCEEMGVQPSVFYTWQKELFCRGKSVFDTKPGRPKIDRSEEKISALEGKLAKKDSVISELLEEHVALKKSLGVI
jgi:transposase